MGRKILIVMLKLHTIIRYKTTCSYFFAPCLLYVYLYYGSDSINSKEISKKSGLSVRCIQSK